jgi:hypothetical protein
MSFGFSVGDFLAAATLIKDLVSALNGTAALEYRELELELHGLQQALGEIENLKPGPGQELSINAVKVAALMCWYPLEDFHTKLKRYKRLSDPGQEKKLDVVKAWGRKAQWNFSMPEEVRKLRAYIAAHVGSLNMRLTTLGLATIEVAKSEASERGKLIRDGLERQTTIIDENTAKVESLSAVVAGRLLPQIQSLVELVGKVWTLNVQTMDYFTKLQNNSAKIDIKHTWFQEPMKLEDAFGRAIPIPAEYRWSVRLSYGYLIKCVILTSL